MSPREEPTCSYARANTRDREANKTRVPEAAGRERDTPGSGTGPRFRNEGAGRWSGGVALCLFVCRHLGGSLNACLTGLVTVLPCGPGGTVDAVEAGPLLALGLLYYGTQAIIGGQPGRTYDTALWRLNSRLTDAQELNL